MDNLGNILKFIFVKRFTEFFIFNFSIDYEKINVHVKFRAAVWERKMDNYSTNQDNLVKEQLGIRLKKKRMSKN